MRCHPSVKANVLRRKKLDTKSILHIARHVIVLSKWIGEIDARVVNKK